MSLRDIQLARKRELDERESSRVIVPGVILEIGGSSEYPYGKNLTWVKEFYGESQTQGPAFNKTGITLPGTPVLIAKDPKAPYRREIIGVNTQTLIETSPEAISNYEIGSHGQNHQIPTEATSGIDPVLIFQPALQMLKTVGNNDLTITVRNCVYVRNGIRRFFQGEIVDLEPSVPSSGMVRRVLIYLDTSSNIIEIVNGAPVPSGGIFPVPFPQIPEDSIPSSYVTLENGQTEIVTASHVLDTREMLSVRRTTEMLGATKVGQVAYSVDGVSLKAETPITNKGVWLADGGTLLVNNDN